ncbi:PilZ domain-containing protein [Leptospira mayottensis]|uniref:Type IV pilus assembly protein PilZ n=2 Tax=Leptospira mayottensis TaxID=1137606 RepID=A0AA87SY75_9LEPT|nr:PilZ domain-containing protein [Leptospira mayottensis]AXR60408.1 PilZ domain-containing protein [Leptospira mayottensis]AXR64222.1 PilZ domain-containing protein [Leptospira mayottensis]AXR67934.1 PilZ domain-containing protein [Leptospira mayottensis]AZQ03165.1 PilZ domain-containing protein [Leptospira mayottensis 200901116]EKS02045.1 type IV pilus assembly protein PilZ [Leptospira mayottensis 200901122]
MVDANSLFRDSFEYRDPSLQKRKDARIKIVLDAEISIKGKQEKHPVTILDIGTGGVALDSRITMFEGDYVHLHARINGKNLILETKIIRSSGKKVNGVFIGIGNEHRTEIQEFIHRKFFGKQKKLN